jgi:hypothetical protein
LTTDVVRSPSPPEVSIVDALPLAALERLRAASPAALTSSCCTVGIGLGAGAEPPPPNKNDISFSLFSFRDYNLVYHNYVLNMS